MELCRSQRALQEDDSYCALWLCPMWTKNMAKKCRRHAESQSEQPNQNVPLSLQRRVKKTSKTISVDEGERTREDGGHPITRPARCPRSLPPPPAPPSRLLSSPSHPMEATSRVKAENGLEETRGTDGWADGRTAPELVEGRKDKEGRKVALAPGPRPKRQKQRENPAR